MQFHQQFVQGVYAAGNLSLTEYYAERRKLTADGVQGELNQLIDEQARLEVELENGGFKNEAERTGVQTKLNEARAASANLALKAQRDASLASLEEAAAVKALSDRVVEYRANLLQLAGDDAGAARLRTAQTIAAAQLLAKQPAGSQSPIDEQSVLLQRDLADAADAYAEAQKKIGLFTNLATSAEELFLRTALRTGASLAETERGVSAIRGRSLLLLREQLALLRATAGTDAKKLADVAALATQIEIAADRSNAALNRLRETVQSLGASAAASLSSSLVHFSSLFEKRRDDADKAVKQERDGYDRQIRELESYLAKSFDRKDRARLQDLINQAKAKSAGAGESRDTTRLKTLERDVLAPLVQQATDAVAKLLIEDPLKAYIQGQLKALTEGDGEIAKFLKSFLGIKPGETDPAKIAALETAAALNALTAAATGAAGALAGGGVASTISSGDFARFDRLPAGSTDPAPFNAFLDKLTKTGTAAADNFGSASTSLIASTLKTGSAFGGLPGLLSQFGNGMIQALQTLASASGGGSGGGLGGIASLISSFFSGGNTGTLPTGDFARFDRMPKLAVGTNFVPYDGFKASLHRGEAVVPAKYNPAAGGGFGGSQQGSRPVLVNIVNNGEPVKAKSTQRETSEGTVIDLVLDAVAADMAGGGKVHDATQRRFGLNPGGSTPRN